MNIAIINMTCAGSTGRIMMLTAKAARRAGNNVRTFSPVEFSKKYEKSVPPNEYHEFYGSWLERRIDNLFGRVLGCNGMGSVFGTLSLIRKLKKNKVTLVHLHNLHSYCINFPLLFGYFKKNKITVVWTLHDCWTFTGHCPHFAHAKCDKWLTGCHHCEQYRMYPQSLTDNSKYQYYLKKKWFTSLDNMTIITPSQWLSEQVGRSFLKNYPRRVINNGIDLSVFYPRETDYKKRNGLENKHVILGVSFEWEHTKGLDVFEELSRRLNSDYQIILVGASEYQKDRIPDNIITVPQTKDANELAEIYSAADVFVNPTRADTFPTVNIEAIACGTPVVTFDSCGSAEIIDETCGRAVKTDDVDGMEREIRNLCEKEKLLSENCVLRAQKYELNDRFREYADLYAQLNGK